MYKTDCHLEALIVIRPRPFPHPNLTQYQVGELIHAEDILPVFMYLLLPISGYATRSTPSGSYTQYAPPHYSPGGYAPPRDPPRGNPYSGTYAPPPGPPGDRMGYPPPVGPAGYPAPPGPPPMPPTGQQGYNYQPAPGGQMQPAYFQYSQCNGKKKALLV
jgi:hypothetical protein